ncbi:MAG: SBBP repeat-containing protein [Pyrinomonadaceae bacterium MAG19_C2-C3]|nr:SBBP repeat-containing protein [Pyrinomonadaceae bacterium MAG19_C2-C3]
MASVLSFEIYERKTSSASHEAECLAGSENVTTLQTDDKTRPHTHQVESKLSEPSRNRLKEAYGKTPLSFEANQGQTASQVKFVSRNSNFNVYLTATEAVLDLSLPRKSREPSEDDEHQPEVSPRQLSDDKDRAVIRLQLLNSNRKPRLRGLDQLTGKSNYFIGTDSGQWRREVPQYARVRYANVYPGIDVVYYGNQRQLEYDFVVTPGADPRQIKFKVAGADRIEIADDGDLLIHSAGGILRQQKPFVYQEIEDGKREVASRYVLTDDASISFQLAAYDQSKQIVIDPVLIYSSLVGGVNAEQGLAIAVDRQGSAYIAGRTDSMNFPVTGAALQNTNSGGGDAFIVKLNPAGTSIVYATYLGGNGFDSITDIAIDDEGNAYITGWTDSNTFPRTANAPQQSPAGSLDAFITKINTEGSALIYSTFLGGANFDQGLGIAIDREGGVYVAGVTDSPNLTNPDAPKVKSGSPNFISENAGGNWNTRDNGLTASAVTSYAIDPTDARTVYAGTLNGVFKSVDGGGEWRLTGSSRAMSPTTTNAIVIDPATPTTVYAATFSGVYKSIDGGDSYQVFNSGFFIPIVYSLLVDPTTPTTLYAGTLTGAYKTTNGGANWTEINVGLSSSPFNNSAPRVNELGFDPANSTTIYAGTSRGMYKTTNGGVSWTAINNGLGLNSFNVPEVIALAVDPLDPATIYVGVQGFFGGIYKSTDGGSTWSVSNTGLSQNVSGTNFTLTVNALAINPMTPSTLYAGTSSGVYKSTDSGSTWSASNTGLSNTVVNALVIDRSTPTTIYAGTNSGTDAFVAKLNQAGTNFDYVRYLGGDETDSARDIVVDASSNAYVTGSTRSTNFPTANPLQAVNNGFFDSYVTKLDATGSTLLYSTYLGGGSNDSGLSLALDASGNILLTGSTFSIDFPVANAFRTTNGNAGFSDAFVSKIAANGATLDYSTYLGGDNGSDQGLGIAVDASGNAYVTGVTSSPNFPVRDAIKPILGGSSDAFLTKINLNNSELSFSTFFGGSGSDQANAIAVDAKGDAYIVGTTDGFNFPGTNPQQGFRSNDAFIAKIGSGIDLALTMTDAPDPVRLGDDLTYTLNVTNNGDVTATGVTLIDTLPARATLVSAVSNQGTCFASAANEVTCRLGNINANQTAQITIVIKPPVASDITNTARVTADESENNQSDNTATVSTHVIYTDVSISNTTSHLRIEAGGSITYILTVRNAGPETIENLTVTNILPVETTFVACTATESGVCSGSGNNRTITFPSILKGKSATATLVAMVNESAAINSQIENTATLDSPLPDIDVSNSTARVTATVISPDRSPRENGKIAFVSRRSGDEYIHVMNPDGTGQTRLINPNGTGPTPQFPSGRRESEPVWSPDSTRLAFVRGTDGTSEIFIVNSDGTGLRQLTTNNSPDNSPTWSPDGTRIAYRSGGESGGRASGIYIANVDGSGEMRVSEGSSPRWSPDGARLAISRGFFGTSLIYIDGSAPVNIPLPSMIEWSPDGSKFVYRKEGGIYIANIDGTGETLVAAEQSAVTPAWSPDGSKIVFASFINSTGGIYVVNLDGSERRRLTDVFFDEYPTWQRRQSNDTPLPPTYRITGRIVRGDNGAGTPSSVTLTGTRMLSVSADFNGNFIFYDLPEGGDYTITASNIFVTGTPASQTFANLRANQTANFSVVFNRHTISGRVTERNGRGVAGLTVFLRQFFNARAQTTTDANGYYEFRNVSAGYDYSVHPSHFSLGSNPLYPKFKTLPTLDRNFTVNFTYSLQPLRPTRQTQRKGRSYF